MTETYESIQGDAKGPGTDGWRAVDKERAALSGLYRSLAEDDTRTPEYKTEKAWAEYEKTKARVEQLAPEARRKMLKSAEGLERMSIPRPEGESLITEDTDKLLLSAHERSRIEGLMSRSKEAAAKGPFKAKNPTDILKREFEHGLDEGGPSGGAKVRAVGRREGARRRGARAGLGIGPRFRGGRPSSGFPPRRPGGCAL